jgi:hypothetical protein
MKLLVAALEKRKFAVNEPKRPRGEAEVPCEPRRRGEAEEGEAPPLNVEVTEDREAPSELRRRVESSDDGEAPSETPRQRVESSGYREPSSEAPSQQRQRSRYVPAAVRREVYQRGGARCSYVDARGLRCCETRYLELHHLQPFAKNGAHSASNLTLRCSAHNALAAEEDFGAHVVAERRSSSRHEALTRTRVERRSSS